MQDDESDVIADYKPEEENANERLSDKQNDKEEDITASNVRKRQVDKDKNP